MSKIYKTIDLFSGLGGIRKGYEMTGRFKNGLSADVDKYACLTYKHLYVDSSIDKPKPKINITKNKLFD